MLEAGKSPIDSKRGQFQEAWFQPFGFKLRLYTNSAAILAAAEVSFGRFGTVQPAAKPDFTFWLGEQAGANGPLRRPSFRLAGAYAHQTMGDAARLVADVEKGVVEGVFSRSVLSQQSFFRFHFLELAFFVMLAPRGLMGVHGAALAYEGRAILLRAQSGGGKTTLAYAGARRRFQALAEDVVWIDVERQVWWGMPWSFHLLPDARRLFPELAPYQPLLQTNGELKLEVDLESIRPGSTVTAARPGPVVLLERLPGGRSRLEPLDLAAAKPRWLAGSAGTERDFPDYDRHVDHLLRDNVYQLYFGDDIEAGVDLLGTLLVC